LNDSSKSIDSLDEKLKQSTTDKTEADDEDKSCRNGSNFERMIREGNKETKEEAKDLVLVKMNFEKHDSKGTSFDKEDRENGNVCHNGVDTNKDHVATNDLEVGGLEDENTEPVDNLPSLCDDLAELKRRLKNVAQREDMTQNVTQKEDGKVKLNSALQRRRSSQDIFERIDNYRGGDGEVKLKDLVLFLRGVYDNIDDNFEVMLLLNQLSLTGEKRMSLKEWLAMIGDLCEAGWDATEHEHEFDQLTEED